MVFSVSALFFATIISADQASIQDGAYLSAGSNNKLLTPFILSKKQSAFEQGMVEAGWDTHRPQNLAFYNVRQIISRNDIMDLQDRIDKKIASAYHSSRAVDSSA